MKNAKTAAARNLSNPIQADFNARLEAKNSALVAAWAATGSKLTPVEKAALLRRSRDKRLALGHDTLA